MNNIITHTLFTIGSMLSSMLFKREKEVDVKKIKN
jgi:hypothetical protein